MKLKHSKFKATEAMVSLNTERDYDDVATSENMASYGLV